jgi:P4 family phage/plasmid primase-like protien
MKAIEKILKGKRFSQSDKNIPCWIGNSGEPPASITDPSLLIFGKTKTLNLATMELLPPSPHWFNLAALDYDYDPKAECEQWKVFLNEIFGDDDESKATIMEFMGLCLTTITEFQKGLFIKGPKRSGKGTIAYIMESVVGEHNVEPQLMSDFAQDFGIETFVGKTLVAVSDARVEKTKLAGAAEKILSIIGEDKIKVNRKYKGALGVRLQTKLLFLSNMLLKIPDESGVLPSRFIYVKLSKSFYGRENKNLRKQLRTELPGILNFAIEHFHNLLKRGAFIQPKTGKVLHDQMMGLCSPVFEFAQELELYMHPDIIWKRWDEFCKDAEQSPGTRKDLWKELEAAGYNCDFDAARILSKIRELNREVTATELRDCSRKFKNSETRDQKLQEMVKSGRLSVRLDTAGNKQPTKFYSIPNET